MNKIDSSTDGTVTTSSTSAMRDGRQKILDRLRGQVVDVPVLPDPDPAQLTRFDNPIDKFVEMLTFVGGQAHFINSPNQVGEILSVIDVFDSAKRIVSLVPEAVDPNSIAGGVDLTTIDDPHSLASVDWTIAQGEFMVAENGAIWMDGSKLPHRVLLFIAQYLAIVVSRSEIEHHLHDAYARIGTPSDAFGVFVSGPSKTADIEQSLVLGAHGCRTLQVFLTP